MKIHIFHTSENITFNMRIYLLKFCNQILDLHSLGNTGSICTAGSTGIGKFACTLDKMKVIIISVLISASRIRYIGRISCIPSKFVLWSFGIIVCTCAPHKAFPSGSSRSHHHSDVQERSCPSQANSSSFALLSKDTAILSPGFTSSYSGWKTEIARYLSGDFFIFLFFIINSFRIC